MLGVSLVVTLAVLLIWPYVQDRFLTPILPMLGLAGAYAVQRAIERLPRPFRQSALVGGALATCALLAVNSRARSMSVQGVQRSPFGPAVSTIGPSSPTAIVCSKCALGFPSCVACVQ